MNKIVATLLGLLAAGRCAVAGQVLSVTVAPAQSTVFNITQNADLWFFNGATPSNYQTSITLSAAGPTQGAFGWQVTTNQKAIVLENGTSAMTKQNDPTLGATSQEISLAPNDVTIHFTYNGSDVGDYNLTVSAPAENFTTRVNLVNSSAGSGTGFQSVATYRLFDQFDNPIPRPLEVNESFDSASIQDIVSNNWHSALFPLTPNGTISTVVSPDPNPDAFTDTYLRSGVLLSPSGEPPQTPLSTSEVFNVTQRYFAGSTTPGIGRQSNVQTLHWYLDHAQPIPIP